MGQIEVLRDLVAYYCVGCAYARHNLGTPREFTEAALKESPSIDAAHFTVPAFVYALVALLWIWDATIWPRWAVVDAYRMIRRR